MVSIHTLFVCLSLLQPFLSASASLITVWVPRSACPASSSTPSLPQNSTPETTTILSTALVSPTPDADYALNNGEKFVLNVAPQTPSGSRKRQQPSTSWIMPNGNTTTDPSLAAHFQIVDGVLYGPNGTMSTDAGVATMPFVVPSKQGAINTTFAAVNGSLNWTNPEFTENVAQFYQTPVGLLKNALILVKFIGPMNPERGWSPISLVAQSVSDLNLNLGLSSSAPYGAPSSAATGSAALASTFALSASLAISSAIPISSSASSVTSLSSTATSGLSPSSSVSSVTTSSTLGTTSLIVPSSYTSGSSTFSSTPLFLSTATSVASSPSPSSARTTSISSAQTISTTSSSIPVSSSSSASSAISVPSSAAASPQVSTASTSGSSSSSLSSSILSSTSSSAATSTAASSAQTTPSLTIVATSTASLASSSNSIAVTTTPASSSSSRSSVHSSSITATATGPTTVPTVVLSNGMYSFQGCYDDTPSYRDLRNANNAGTADVTGGMTVEKCAAVCGSTTYGGPYSLMGVDYGSECYCSMGLYADIDGSSGYQVDIANCSNPTYACAGDKTEFCGGYGVQDLYSFTSGAFASATPATSLPASSSLALTSSTSAVLSTAPLPSTTSTSNNPIANLASTSPKPSSTTPTTTSTASSTTSLSVRLASPTACLGSLTGASSNDDDDYCEIDLPFSITLFGHSSTKTFPSTNGILALDYGSAQYYQAPLPAASIPPYTACAFWDDLYLYGGTNEGLYYQTNTSNGGVATYEYVLAQAGVPADLYQFQVVYRAANPGVVEFWYYVVGKLGGLAVVGVQGGPSAFQYTQPVYAGLLLTCNTATQACAASNFTI
ncbi:MAG: hypothetical protein M1822_005894 [Bathelium mastoideum]|nr:MAG: hypothetical protein M1822_005894 [Bathelium mastoideum]